MRDQETGLSETQPEPPASALYAVRYSYDWLRAWRYVVVQPSVKHVGLAAATFSNKRGLQVFPGVKRLMAITGHSKPSVIDALAAMRYLGFLWRRSCGQGSESGQADEYQLCLPRTKDHLPMIDPKTGKEPAFHTLPPIAQETAVRLGVAGRLSKRRGGQMTQPGWSTETTTLVRSVNHWWLSQLTPPTHETYASTYSGHHHSDRHDRPDAGASGRKYDFDDEEDCYDYVCDHVPDLDPFESSMMDGMLSSGKHPKAIVNAILAGRQDGAA